MLTHSRRMRDYLQSKSANMALTCTAGLCDITQLGINYVYSFTPGLDGSPLFGLRAGLQTKKYQDSSPGWGHFVVFLGKTFYSHSASFHPSVY